MALYEDAFKKMVDYYTTWGFSMYPNPFLDPVNANQPVVFRDVFRVPDPATGEVVPMVAVEFGGRPRLGPPRGATSSIRAIRCPSGSS
ncbi:hypothetical protein M3Y99_01400200 [Aphelenchoides fujianensis]|nr:hypothetical protein M3Y99_01400200 [Aphelenchoides fujianensis]